MDQHRDHAESSLQCVAYLEPDPVKRVIEPYATVSVGREPSSADHGEQYIAASNCRLNDLSEVGTRL